MTQKGQERVSLDLFEPYVEDDDLHVESNVNELQESDDSQTQAQCSSLQLNVRSGSSPTSRYLNTMKYPGPYGFQAVFLVQPSRQRARSTEFSEKLNKLYIEMDKWVEIRLVLREWPQDRLFIRAVPVYAEAVDAVVPVIRCPHHSQPDHPTNIGFPHLQHLIRFDTDDALYCEDLESGRLSVLAPLVPHQDHSSSSLMMKFLCLGSDVGGPNRRPLQVVLTVEDGGAGVLGRDVVGVRICCCPRRDRYSEEARIEREDSR